MKSQHVKAQYPGSHRLTAAAEAAKERKKAQRLQHFARGSLFARVHQMHLQLSAYTQFHTKRDNYVRPFFLGALLVVSGKSTKSP